MARARILVALLRGINVGGKGLVPMSELRSVLSSLGLEDVETYVQSGNVVFSTPVDDLEALAAQMERAVAEAFGVEPAVILRTPADLDRIARRNPYLAPDADLSQLHVVFLDRAPAASEAAELDPKRSPPDELTLAGREIYLRLASGAGRTKLSLAYLERVLGVRGTQRSWSTLLTLRELAQR